MSAISPGALLTCYLAVTAVPLLTGWSRVYPGGVVAHLAILAAVASATWVRDLPRWLRAWLPLFCLLFLYSEIPMLLRAIGQEALYDDTVISWEQALFDAQPARVWAGRWPIRLASETLHLAYLSYYPLIFSVPVVLWWRRRADDFTEAMFALMLTFIACFTCYLFFPVAGPRYLWLQPVGVPEGPVRAATTWLLEARSSRGTAFPSSHVAVATTQAVLAFRYFGWRGAFIAVLALGLSAGAVYGGFHYAIDVLAGIGVGALVVSVALAIAALLRRPTIQANASAPT